MIFWAEESYTCVLIVFITVVKFIGDWLPINCHQSTNHLSSICQSTVINLSINYHQSVNQSVNQTSAIYQLATINLQINYHQSKQPINYNQFNNPLQSGYQSPMRSIYQSNVIKFLNHVSSTYQSTTPTEYTAGEPTVCTSTKPILAIESGTCSKARGLLPETDQRKPQTSF